MLEHLTHYSAVLIANGPRGSYRQARNSPERWRDYENFRVAFQLARGTGMIKNKYFTIEGQVITFRVSENLVKVQKIASALEELKQRGVLSTVKNGRLVYQKNLSRSEVIEAVRERLSQIKGFGPALELASLEDALADILIPEDKVSRFQGVSHFLGTYGLYSVLLDRLSVDLSAGRVLYEHKASDAERVSYPQNLPDYLCTLAETEVRRRDIEAIKEELKADHHGEIQPLANPGGGPLPRYTFVISDVHLREYHHENSDDLLRLIWMVKRLNGELIINGDFFDIWRAGGLEKAWINNTRLVNALTKLRSVILVTGNHDEFLFRLAKRGGIFANPKIRVVNHYESADQRIRIMHGHQFDAFNRQGARLGRWFTRLVTRLEFPRVRAALQGTFSSLANLLGFFFGPRLSARLLMIPRLILPTSYVIDRQMNNILVWLKAEVDKAMEKDSLKLDPARPVTFVIGHLHYEGISFLSEQVHQAVQREFGGAVRLIITDSWEGGAGYVGDYVVITEQKETAESTHFIRKAIWPREKQV